MQKFETVKAWMGYDEWEPKILPVITKEQLLTIHPKYIVSKRDRGISGFNKNSFIYFVAPEGIAKESGLNPRGEYAVNVGDYLEVLATCPNYPNKKESKQLRRERAKKKH